VSRRGKSRRALIDAFLKKCVEVHRAERDVRTYWVPAEPFQRPVWCVLRDGKFLEDANGFPKVCAMLAEARGFAFYGLDAKEKRRHKVVEMHETLEPRESRRRKR